MFRTSKIVIGCDRGLYRSINEYFLLFDHHSGSSIDAYLLSCLFLWLGFFKKRLGLRHPHSGVHVVQKVVEMNGERSEINPPTMIRLEVSGTFLLSLRQTIVVVVALEFAVFALVWSPVIQAR